MLLLLQLSAALPLSNPHPTYSIVGLTLLACWSFALSALLDAAGDGNCAYRAVLMGILEGAAAADDYSRMMLGQQLGELYRKLPEWARSSFNGKSNVAYGHGLLKASACTLEWASSWSSPSCGFVVCHQF